MAVGADSKMTDTDVRGDIIPDPSVDLTFEPGLADFEKADESSSNGRERSVGKDPLELPTGPSNVSFNAIYKEKSEKHVWSSQKCMIG